MGQSILVADPRHVFYNGLREFFLHEMPDALIDVKTSLATLQTSIATQTYDLMIVNQAFLASLSHLTGRQGNLIVLAPKPDKELFLPHVNTTREPIWETTPQRKSYEWHCASNRGNFCSILRLIITCLNR